MTGHKIYPSCLPRTFLLVFEGNQKERGQRHYFPGHQEKDAIACEDNDHHAGDEQIEEEPRRSERLVAAVLIEIFGAVNRSQRAQPEDGNQKEAAQRIKFEEEASVRDVP